MNLRAHPRKQELLTTPVPEERPGELLVDDAYLAEIDNNILPDSWVFLAEECALSCVDQGQGEGDVCWGARTHGSNQSD